MFKCKECQPVYHFCKGRRYMILSCLVCLVLLQFIFFHLNGYTLRKEPIKSLNKLLAERVTSPHHHLLQNRDSLEQNIGRLFNVSETATTLKNESSRSKTVLQVKRQALKRDLHPANTTLIPTDVNNIDYRYKDLVKIDKNGRSSWNSNHQSENYQNSSGTYLYKSGNYHQKKMFRNRYSDILKQRKCPLCLKRNEEKRAILEEKKHALIVANLNKTLVRNDNCNGCFKHVFKYIISGDHVCSGRRNVDLVFLITTTHASFKERETLRNTWLTLTRPSNMTYVFLLGETSDQNLSRLIEIENSKYQDIVKEDFVDSYDNLTHKTMMALKWVTHKCSQAQYIMKTDQDMLIDPPKLLRFLKKPYIKSSLENSVVGRCWKGKPFRNNTSKYYTSYESYPHLHFPSICSGTGYVMSMHTATKIYEISPNVPFFRLEDVYIGLCLQELGFQTHDYSGFLVEGKLTSCYLRWWKVYTFHARHYIHIQQIWNSCKHVNYVQSNLH